MSSTEFSFVFDSRLQEILERDFHELMSLNSQTATKAIIVLAGGVIEGLLIDALVASGKWTFEESCQRFLKDMIGAAVNAGIIKEDRLTDATRKYRNIIHPGREIREQMVFEKVDADLARAAVSIVIREVRLWSLAEQKRRKVKNILNKINQYEIELLQLFGQPKPTSPSSYDHPWLEHKVYMAVNTLSQKEVIETVKDDQLLEYQEKIRLMPDVIEFVEQLVLKGKIQRDAIILSLKNIAASNIGGSGAPSYSRAKRLS